MDWLIHIQYWDMDAKYRCKLGSSNHVSLAANDRPHPGRGIVSRLGLQLSGRRYF